MSHQSLSLSDTIRPGKTRSYALISYMFKVMLDKSKKEAIGKETQISF